MLRARLLALDYEGLSDGRSMRTILSHVAPRHLVLTHGAPEVTIPDQARMRPSGGQKLLSAPMRASIGIMFAGAVSQSAE